MKRSLVLRFCKSASEQQQQQQQLQGVTQLEHELKRIVLHFGKFKGTAILSVPDAYLDWAVRTKGSDRIALRAAQVLELRKQKGICEPATDAAASDESTSSKQDNGDAAGEEQQTTATLGSTEASADLRSVVLGFGKFKGISLLEIPDSYLAWMSKAMERESIGIQAKQALAARKIGVPMFVPAARAPSSSPVSEQVDIGEIKAAVVGFVGADKARDLADRVGRSVYSRTTQVYVSNLLVLLLGKNGCIGEAKQVFHRIEKKDSYSFNTMLKVLIDSSCLDEAVALFEDMVPMGVASPISCTAMIKVYSNQRNMNKEVDSAFYSIPAQDRDTRAWNSFIGALSRAGRLDDAKGAFDEQGVQGMRDVVSWNALLVTLAAEDRKEAFRLMPAHDSFSWNIAQELGDMPESERSIVSYNMLLNARVKAGEVQEAIALFHAMPAWSIVTLTVMANGFAQTGQPELVEELFNIGDEGRDCISWSSLLRAYQHNPRAARCVFDRMPQHDEIAINLMFVAYAQEGEAKSAKHLFDSLPQRSRSSWSLLLYASKAELGMAVGVFERMPAWDIGVSTNMMVAYAAEGMLDEVQEVFHNMEQHDIGSWTTLVAAYAQAGHLADAESMLLQMPAADYVAFVALLAGYVAHSDIDKFKLAFDRMPERGVWAWTLAVAAYAQAGDVMDARNALLKAPAWDATVWNSLIAGYARLGMPSEAFYEQATMCLEGIPPTPATFTCLLAAASNKGRLKCAHDAFVSMLPDYGLHPGSFHYTAMVSALAKAGKLDEANDLLRDMPFYPAVLTWHAYLSGCRLFAAGDLAAEAGKNASALAASDTDHALTLLLQILAKP